MSAEVGTPALVDRAAFQSELDALRVREKAHTREGDAIAAARRRLPMVEVEPTAPLVGGGGRVTLLDAFEGRTQLIAYYFMWHAGHSAAEQCEGCTWCATQVAELSYLHSRDITYAVLCQGPAEESLRYREFMGWDMPWYSARDSLGTLLVGRQEPWEHSPPDWPQRFRVDGSNTRTNGRPTAQWSRLQAGRSDTLSPIPEVQGRQGR